MQNEPANPLPVAAMAMQKMSVEAPQDLTAAQVEIAREAKRDEAEYRFASLCQSSAGRFEVLECLKKNVETEPDGSAVVIFYPFDPNNTENPYAEWRPWAIFPNATSAGKAILDAYDAKNSEVYTVGWQEGGAMATQKMSVKSPQELTAAQVMIAREAQRDEAEYQVASVYQSFAGRFEVLECLKKNVETEPDGSAVVIFYPFDPNNTENPYAEWRPWAIFPNATSAGKAILDACDAENSEVYAAARNQMVALLRSAKEDAENQRIFERKAKEDSNHAAGMNIRDEEEDQTEIEKRNDIGPTTKRTLIDSRKGQGRFRAEVLQLWDNRCSVTGSSCGRAIRASHIKPWRESTDEQRLDPCNGLPLIANLDALFDAGLISFEGSGRLIVSPEFSAAERKIFGVGEQSLSKKPNAKTAVYLAYHRCKHGFEG